MPRTEHARDLGGKAGAPNVARIGDCDAPGAIFAAVYAGHRFAQEIDTGPTFKRERIGLAEVSPFDTIA